MFRKISFSLYFLFLIVGFSAQSAAQSLSDNPDYCSLSEQYAKLKTAEDSLSAKLSASRKLFENGNKEEQKVATADIVRLEGEIYDLKAQLSRLSGRIAGLEQEFAEQSLRNAESVKMERTGFFANDIFTKNLSRKDLTMLSTAGKAEQKVLEQSVLVKSLYAKLKSLKVEYDLSCSQGELDRIKAQATSIKAQISKADTDARTAWNSVFNFKTDTYFTILDKLNNVDRATTEMLESQGREARRAEAFAEAFITPQISAFEAQRKYLQVYEKVIAKSEKLTMALDSLNRIKPIVVALDSMVDVSFDPRVLTLYGAVTFRKDDMPINNIDQVPSAIIPDKGLYYSVQIALMASAPKNLDMFKGAWPLQVESTSDGKLRYMVGGFDTYSTALAGVVKLQKAGYRAPIMMAWLDGKPITPAKAKVYESTRPKEEGTIGRFKVEVTTSDVAVGEKVKSLVDMHAKDKSIARMVNGKELVFTIAEFDDTYDAQVLAQIIKDRTGAQTRVVEIAW